MIKTKKELSYYIDTRLKRVKDREGIARNAEILACVEAVLSDKSVYGKLALQDRFILRLSQKQLENQLDLFLKHRSFVPTNTDLRSLTQLLERTI